MSVKKEGKKEEGERVSALESLAEYFRDVKS